MPSVRTLFVLPLTLTLKYFNLKRPIMYKILRKHAKWLIFLLLLKIIAVGFIYQVIFWSIHPVVQTNLGLIRGLKASDGDYSMYLGIPFAKVNESNPFGHAIPYPPFEGIFNAIDDSVACPQIDEYTNKLIGQLDCLHVNIYVPNSASSTHRLPVLVYIFGGKFDVGAPGRHVYGPKFLVRHDIILVTLNYRLGPYGFQCLALPEVPGNQGLKDQLMALRWVKKNIDAFGGDSNKITIAGESSGGQNVDFHVMYGDEGLFSRAIIGAGAALDSVTMILADSTVPVQIAGGLGYVTDDFNEALSFLAQQDPHSVISASNKLNIVYGPCVELEFEDVGTYITQFPKDRNNIEDITVMIGQSTHELLHIFANENFDSDKHKNIFKEMLSKYFDFGDRLQSMVDYVQKFYIGNEEVNEAVKPQIIDFCSDLAINYPIYKKLQQYLKNNAKIYYGMFAYAGRRNFMKMFSHVDLDSEGTSHVDEIGYLFDVSYMREPITPNDQLIIDRMTTLWANFVKYGNPTIERTDIVPVEWEPVMDKTFPYLKIGLEVSKGYAPFRERMTFWDEFFAANGTIDSSILHFT